MEPADITEPETPQKRSPTRRRPKAQPRSAGSASKDFAFVSYDPTSKPDPEARKFIRSHVMRGKNTRSSKRPEESNQEIPDPETSPDESSRQSTAPESAVNPEDNASASSSSSASASAKNNDRTVTVRSAYLPKPLQPPPDLTLFNFASPLDDRSRYLLQRFFTTIKETLYPAEWCFESDSTKVCWFRWLHTDAAYLHSVLFMVSAFQDVVDSRRMGIESSAGSSSNTGLSSLFSARTRDCLRKTIQLLQESLDNEGREISDSTTVVVTTLAMMADAAGDMAACQAHVDGLKKIVKMRGGLQNFHTSRQVQVKICRVDLGWSIKHGSKPGLYEGDISWDPFLNKIVLSTPLRSDIPLSPEVQTLVESWDHKLRNVFYDIRDFSRLANTFMVARQKLQPELFQEIMLSIQYRLLLLEYSLEYEQIKEAVRLGLLAFETTVFLQIPDLKLEYSTFSEQLREAIETLIVSDPATAELKLWLLFIGTIIAFDANERWLVASVKELTIGSSWESVRERLKKIMWIDLIHDRPGRQAFETIQRL